MPYLPDGCASLTPGSTLRPPSGTISGRRPCSRWWSSRPEKKRCPPFCRCALRISESRGIPLAAPDLSRFPYRRPRPAAPDAVRAAQPSGPGRDPFPGHMGGAPAFLGALAKEKR